MVKSRKKKGSTNTENADEGSAIELAISPSPVKTEELPPTNMSQNTITDRLQSEAQLKVIFVLTLLCGLAGGYYDSWKIPALAVLAYAIAGTAITRNETNIERFVDSLYYMGFLFTIWGLFFAFGPWAENVENLSSKTIITQFGIKLITTVIALTARILIVQLRTSSSEQIDEPHIALAQMAETMSLEIKQSVGTFREARDQILAEAQTGVSEANKAALATIEENLQKFQSATNSLLNSANASLNNLLERLSAVDVPRDVIASRLNAAAQVIAGDMTKLQEIVQTANTGVSQGLSDALARIENATKRFDASLAILSNVEKLASHSDRALKSVFTSVTHFDDTISNTTRLLGEMATTFSDLHRTAAADVTKIRGSIEAAASEITNLAETVRSDAERFSKTMTDGVRLLREEVERR
jgi:hypothetical protein